MGSNICNLTRHGKNTTQNYLNMTHCQSLQVMKQGGICLLKGKFKITYYYLLSSQSINVISTTVDTNP